MTLARGVSATGASFPGIGDRIPRRTAVGLGLAACGLAVWFDTRRIFATFPPDGDLLDTVLLARGVHRSGLGFLRSWGYTPDNWLLSLLAPEYPWFGHGDPTATAIVGAGGVILMLVALAGSLLGWLACRHAMACLALLLFLLLPGQDAIGRVGFLGYAVTHNVTLLWGLIGASLAVAALGCRTASVVCLPALGSATCLVVAAISDPWADAALLLPMLLADAALLVTRARAAAAVLLAAHAVCALVVGTRMFGMLDFLPTATLGMGGVGSIRDHSIAAMEGLARLWWPFGFVRPPAWGEADTTISIGVAGAGLAALCWSGATIVRFRSAVGPETFYASLFIGLSMLGTLSAFSISALPIESTNGRFFCNVWTLGPILVAIAVVLRRRSGRTIGGGALVLGLGLAVTCSSFAEGIVPFVGDRGAVDGLASFLLKNDLRCGYGPYWGTQANAVTWRSGWRVHLRPVVFDRGTGFIGRRGAETSRDWYARDDRPPGASRTFVVLAPDPENCLRPGLCERGLSRQFGRPDEILRYREMRVWVWNRILPTISPEEN